MGDIRRQTIFSSLLIYVGFIFGALNTYLFTREGFFTPDQYGLTQAIIAINMTFYAFANFGSVAIMGRFYPVYYGQLKKEKNDLLSLAFLLAGIGLVLTIAGAIIGKPLFVRKFSEKSALLVHYYYWIIPYVCFYVVFCILEAQAAINKKTILSNFLKETASRMVLTMLMLLYIFNIISFDVFVKCFSGMYAVVSIVLFIFLLKTKRLHLAHLFSNVSRRLKKRLVEYISYPLFGAIIYNTALNIDSFTIGSKLGLSVLGVYTLAKYISSVISVPQRSVASIAVPYVAQAFKDKRFDEVRRIYMRSAINLLIIALFVFLNVWINLDDAYQVFHLDKSYEAGKYVILILGIAMLLDMGTGINGYMLYVSPIWRFEFFNAIIVMAISIPTNYFMVDRFGIIGAAFSTLFMIFTTNTIRYCYIWYKYKMQPFSINSLWALLLAVFAYFLSYFLFNNIHGWGGLLLRSFSFSFIFLAGVIYFKLTPDIKPVLDSIQKRFGRS